MTRTPTASSNILYYQQKRRRTTTTRRRMWTALGTTCPRHPHSAALRVPVASCRQWSRWTRWTRSWRALTEPSQPRQRSGVKMRLGPSREHPVSWVDEFLVFFDSVCWQRTASARTSRGTSTQHSGKTWCYGGGGGVGREEGEGLEGI